MGFVSLYRNRPSILFSPAGLTTKIAQILLEVGLIYLIASYKTRQR